MKLGFEPIIEYARQHWREFSQSKPGRRFQDRYRRRQKRGHGPFGVRRIVNIVLGVAIVLVSAVFGLAPGPGWGTALIGFGLIAGEFRPAARLLDWAEVWLRRFIQFCKDVWNISPLAGKVLIVVVLLACVIALGYGTYYLIFGGPA